MLNLAILFIILAASFFWYKKKHGRRDFLLKQFPAPKGVPILHHSVMFIGKNPQEVFKLSLELEARFNKIFHLSFGAFDDAFVFVMDAKIIEGFLTSQTVLDKSIDYELLKPWIGIGLLVSSDKKWFQRRKVKKFIN
jgi:cytochrome P450 family 4